MLSRHWNRQASSKPGAVQATAPDSVGAGVVIAALACSRSALLAIDALAAALRPRAHTIQCQRVRLQLEPALGGDLALPPFDLGIHELS
jgi:hypothetical protein